MPQNELPVVRLKAVGNDYYIFELRPGFGLMINKIFNSVLTFKDMFSGTTRSTVVD